MSDLVRLHNAQTGVTVNVDSETAKRLEGFEPVKESKAPAKKAASSKSNK